MGLEPVDSLSLPQTDVFKYVIYKLTTKSKVLLNLCLEKVTVSENMFNTLNYQRLRLSNTAHYRVSVVCTPDGVGDGVQGSLPLSNTVRDHRADINPRKDLILKFKDLILKFKL